MRDDDGNGRMKKWRSYCAVILGVFWISGCETDPGIKLGHCIIRHAGVVTVGARVRAFPKPAPRAGEIDLPPSG